jgi:hypothetical protein
VGLIAARLSGLLERALGPGAGQDAERVQRLREIGDADPDGWPRAAYELHVDLLTRLQTGDGTLSRAHELGRSITAQDTIDDLRGDLWEAHLDAAVAQSILPPPPVTERRSRLSLGKPPAPVLGPGERLTVRQRVERALHVTTAARQQGLHVPASGPATATPHEATTTEQPSANGTAPRSDT